MDDQIKAGKVPGPAPAEAIAELTRLDAELALAGSSDIRTWVPAPERGLIFEAVSATPALFGSVMFYGALVLERLRLLTEDEPYNSPAARIKKGAAHEVARLEQHVNIRREDAELYRTARSVRTAVELADLHLLHEKHALTIEQLEAAKPAPAGR
jgi:hypothetical protein